MAGLFTPGDAKQTAQPGALAPADIASRLFAIKLLLARLAQSGGAPQTLGEYISQGPRKLPASTIGDASSGLMAALQQPGAFTRGPAVTKTQPSSPSLFQDASGGLVTLALLSTLLKGQGGISGSVGSEYDWLKNILGGGTPDGSGGLGPTDQIGMTMDPTYTTPDSSSQIGFTEDPSITSGLFDTALSGY